ncbi:UDP-N-acetylglucosamine 4,6-dehydratase (inverting) [bacterium]|nr:UDP-N-acetylglucosamine 4,6-dehydratase (inverting) [bacterium]|tara:strand:- start:2421 stop:3416 length:996 start_codon:yes stop_codon:yes gene_type:complete
MKNILITGGTGSFGKMFVKEVLEKENPSQISIFSRDELKQFEMKNYFNSEKLKFYIGDVRDRARLADCVSGVDTLIHAAALKQVPATEYNPSECVKTNINGAENVIDASIRNKVSKVIALSTDKAGNPINLYGASKLVSDKLFISANNRDNNKETKFSVVRYGNVVGSRGSIVPYFRNLIESGSKTLPITHKDMTRFWISLNQGVEFVLKSLNRMSGGETFIPKIPSVLITDLADAMGPNLKKHIIGIRPGEKIHETMCPIENAHLTLDFSDHYVIKPSINLINHNNNYSVNNIGEESVPVGNNFEYSSGTNEYFLNIEEILEFNKNLKMT